MSKLFGLVGLVPAFLAAPASAGGNEFVVLSVPPPGSQTSIPSAEIRGFIVGDPGPQEVFEVYVQTRYQNGQTNPVLNNECAYDPSALGWGYEVTDWDPVQGVGRFEGRAKFFQDSTINTIEVYLPTDTPGNPSYTQEIYLQTFSTTPADVVLGVHPVQRSVDTQTVSGDAGEIAVRLDLINTTDSQSYTVDVFARCTLPDHTEVNLPMGGPGLDAATYTVAPGDFQYTSVIDPVGMTFSFPLDQAPFPQPIQEGEYKVDFEVYDGPALIYFEQNVSYWVSDRSGKAFRDVTELTGLDAVHLQGGNRPSAGNSIAAFDYQGDGLTDLFFSNPSGSEAYIAVGDNWPFPGGRNYLMANNGDGTFSDVTFAAGVEGDNSVASYGVCWGDIDADGDNDLVVANREHAFYVYSNNGDGTFTDVAESSFGGPTNRWFLVPRLGDYDEDGDLDLFAGCYMNQFSTTWVNIGFTNLLYRNELTEGVMDPLVPGFPMFTRVNNSGLEQNGDTLGAFFSDQDRDGSLDLFVHNDFGPFNHPNEFYKGDGTDLGWTDVAAAAGFDVREFSMGSCAADFDGDGLQDLYTSSMGRNSLLLNNGDGTVTQSIVGSGAEGSFVTEGPQADGINLDDSWAALAFDFDLDADMDIYNVGAYIFTGWNLPVPDLVPDSLYENDGTAHFTKVSESLGTANAAAGRGAVYIDLDGDGDLDIVTSNENEGVTAMRNDFVTPYDYVTLRPRAVRSAPGGFNTRFEIQGATSGLQSKEIGAESPGASTLDNFVTFGVRNDPAVQTTAHWNSGGSTTYFSLPAGQEHLVWESVLTVGGQIQNFVQAGTAPDLRITGEPGAFLIGFLEDQVVPFGLPLPGGGSTDVWPMLASLVALTPDANGEAVWNLGTIPLGAAGLVIDMQAIEYDALSGTVPMKTGLSRMVIQ